MLRKMMIALFAAASVAMLAPDAASARGGFGGGGGGFHGVAVAVSTAVAAVRRRLPRRRHGNGRRRFPFCCDRRRRFPFGCDRRRRFPFGRICRLPDFAAAALPSTSFRGRLPPRISGIGDFHCRGGSRTWPGLRLYYDYYDDGYPYYGSYDDAYYYGDSGCYIVRRSVLTPYGWRIRPVQVCG